MLEKEFLNTLVVLGSRDLVFVMAAVVVIVFLLMPRQKQKQMLLYAVILFPVAYILATIASTLYFNSRPFVEGGFIPLLPHAPDNGFPSNHALFAAALAAFVFPYQKWIGGALAVLAVLVGFSRVYAGIHHPIDILASFFIVVIVAFAVLRFSFFGLDNKSAGLNP